MRRKSNQQEKAMRQTASVAALMLTSMSTIAFAADMPIKAPRWAPAPAAVYDWSGLYVGGDVGWQTSSIGLLLSFAALTSPENARSIPFTVYGRSK